MNTRLRAVLGSVLLLLVAGCQSLKPAPTATSTAATTAQQFQLSCTGVPNCQVARMNQLQGAQLAAYAPRSKPKRSIWTKLQAPPADTASASNATANLILPAAQYETVVYFYPISQARAEIFHMMHHFRAGQRYQLNMYRQRNRSAGSLLNVSSPDPLCVDLIESTQVIRRFCRPFNAVTGTGEFIEQHIEQRAAQRESKS